MALDVAHMPRSLILWYTQRRRIPKITAATRTNRHVITTPAIAPLEKCLGVLRAASCTMMEGEGTAVDERGIWVGGGGVCVTLTKKVVVDVGKEEVEVTDASVDFLLLVVAVSKSKESAEAVFVTVIVIGPVRIKPEGSAGVRLTRRARSKCGTRRWYFACISVCRKNEKESAI